MRASRTEATLADGSAAETGQALADVDVEVSVTGPHVPGGTLAVLLATVLGLVHSARSPVPQLGLVVARAWAGRRWNQPRNCPVEASSAAQ